MHHPDPPSPHLGREARLLAGLLHGTAHSLALTSLSGFPSIHTEVPMSLHALFGDPQPSFRPHLSPYQSRATTLPGLAAELATLLAFLATGHGATLAATRHGLCGPFSFTVQVERDGSTTAYLPTGVLAQRSLPEHVAHRIRRITELGWEWPDGDLCPSCEEVEMSLACSFSMPSYSIAEANVCHPSMSQSFDTTLGHYLDAARSIIIGFALAVLSSCPDSLSYQAVLWPDRPHAPATQVDLSESGFNRSSIEGMSR